MPEVDQDNVLRAQIGLDTDQLKEQLRLITLRLQNMVPMAPGEQDKFTAEFKEASDTLDELHDSLGFDSLPGVELVWYQLKWFLFASVLGLVLLSLFFG